MNRAQFLIESGWQARREGRHEDAEEALLQAITTSREAGIGNELIRGLKALAHVVRDLGQDERALPLLEEAVALSREEGDIFLIAHTVRHFGDLHREAGRMAEAEQCYHEAISLYRASSNPPPLDFANAVRPAAMLKEAQDNREAARQLWSEARLLYEAAGVQTGVEECERRLSQLRRPTFLANNELAFHLPDPVAAEAFYVGILGCQVVERSHDCITLESGALRLYLLRDPAPSHDAVVPSFDVPDRPAALAALQAAGCKLVPIGPHAPGEMYVQDPFGIVFDVIARSAPAPA